MSKEFNDVYGQVEQDYSEYVDYDQEKEKVWTHSILTGANDIIKSQGAKWFLDNLPNHAKIAISAYYRQLHTKTMGDPF